MNRYTVKPVQGMVSEMFVIKDELLDCLTDDVYMDEDLAEEDCWILNRADELEQAGY